jgi:hypothetical protein
MKNKLIALLVILIELISLAGTAFAQTAVAGVSVGQTFNYSYSLNWSSTDPTATVPTEYVELNKTQSIQIHVTDISGSKISLEKTSVLKDGTQTQETGYIDINSGTIEINYGSLIVGANLNVNDKLYPSGGHAIINDVSIRTYPSGQRETNHYIYESTDQNNYEKTEIYFDKQTGVAVNYFYENRETSNGNTTTTTETLMCTNTDAWAVASNSNNSGNPTPTATGISPTNATETPQLSSNTLLIIVILIITGIVLVSVVIIALRKSRKPM